MFRWKVMKAEVWTQSEYQPAKKSESLLRIGVEMKNHCHITDQTKSIRWSFHGIEQQVLSRSLLRMVPHTNLSIQDQITTYGEKKINPKTKTNPLTSLITLPGQRSPSHWHRYHRGTSWYLCSWHDISDSNTKRNQISICILHKLMHLEWVRKAGEGIDVPGLLRRKNGRQVRCHFHQQSTHP